MNNLDKMMLDILYVMIERGDDHVVQHLKMIHDLSAAEELAAVADYIESSDELIMPDEIVNILTNRSKAYMARWRSDGTRDPDAP